MGGHAEGGETVKKGGEVMRVIATEKKPIKMWLDDIDDNALEQANSQGHVIDNENNLYVAEASFYPGSGSDSKFYGARIEYEITQPY